MSLTERPGEQRDKPCVAARVVRTRDGAVATCHRPPPNVARQCPTHYAPSQPAHPIGGPEICPASSMSGRRNPLYTGISGSLDTAIGGHGRRGGRTVHSVLTGPAAVPPMWPDRPRAPARLVKVTGMESAADAGMMRAWEIIEPGPAADHPLRMVHRPVPEPGPDELLVRVITWGVCRTDLHLAEGDLPPRPRRGARPRGRRRGRRARRRRHRFARGRPGRHRLAAPHLRRCRFCRRGATRTCARDSRYTGWDDDGGYAELAVVPAELRLPAARRLSPTSSSPRCCAPASSATARCGGPSCRRAGGSASTASAARPTSPPRSRWPRARRCTC